MIREKAFTHRGRLWGEEAFFDPLAETLGYYSQLESNMASLSILVD
jgi:hypothetical protein